MERTVIIVSGWLTSWKTFATLAVLGLLYLVVVLLSEPINWSNVIGGLVTVATCTPLAIVQRRAQHPANDSQ